MKNHSSDEQNTTDISFDKLKGLYNETRFGIITYLSIYKELTLDDLSDLLGRSKSTIHYHIQILLDLEILHETTRSGSKIHYFSIKPEGLAGGIFQDISFLKNLDDRERGDYFSDGINAIRTLVASIVKLLRLLDSNFEQQSKSVDSLTYEQLELKLWENSDFFLNITQFPKGFLLIYQEELNKFNQTIKKKLKDFPKSSEGSDIFTYSLILPVGRLLKEQFSKK
ncbi:MAG: helix-turn-helix domain-containing protein [Candidatus Heimdallarchaeota archaeon]|nr:helix-turn-helix domain-containing protein [Candidatus Heimdallarchaeota archaeon]MCK4878081.1 helix-turn-helix domain-containing protein [Candidatus Heimdallarchaeota archaeon]